MMWRSVILGFLVVVALALCQTHGTMNQTGMFVWHKHSLVKIPNGFNGCANANGCWQVNGVLGPNAAASLTQDVTLFQLPANGFVGFTRIKGVVACTGTTTAFTGLGTVLNNSLFSAISHNIQAAPADTNFVDRAPPAFAAGSNTIAAVDVVASLTTSAGAQFVDTLVDGCAVNYWLSWAVLP
jgi:hypothetical protein